MPSQSLTTIFLALCVVNGVFSIPLGLQPFTAGSTATAQENDNYGRINEAKNLANKNIKKMEYVLNNPALPGHQAMINSAFGTDPSRSMSSIKNTVQSLKHGNVPVALGTAGNTVAFTQYDEHMRPTHVEFGKKYHAKGASTDARAATLVHEATHYLADTGDYIKDGKMLRGSNEETTSKTGYATGMEPKKSASALDGDANWKKMRDGHNPTFGGAVPATKDLHKNAESFAQFSAMCGAAVSDRTVGLRRRAMANGNWAEAAHYLIKRNSCALPKDYFAKKAAAKKAAESKVAGKTPAGTKKALAGAKTLSGKKTALRAKTLVGKKSLVGGKTLAGKKTATRAKALTGKKSLVGAKSLAGKKTTTRAKALSTKSKVGTAKSLAKKGKTLAGSKGKVGSKAVGRKSKVGGVKPLSKGRVARPVSKTAGSRRPTSKVAASKRVGKPAANKHVARPAASKNVAKPKTNSRTAKPVQHAAKPAQRQTKAAPKPIAAATLPKPVAKVVPKKGRRDLEFQL